jgi:hypothetical protein
VAVDALPFVRPCLFALHVACAAHLVIPCAPCSRLQPSASPKRAKHTRTHACHILHEKTRRELNTVLALLVRMHSACCDLAVWRLRDLGPLRRHHASEVGNLLWCVHRLSNFLTLTSPADADTQPETLLALALRTYIAMINLLPRHHASKVRDPLWGVRICSTISSPSPSRLRPSPGPSLTA